ncbi:MAG: bifunctional UDP-N-acetylglucosamine diphosphorylase/glucosamine-1-phosphate N-acetyltransferase GlmU [Synergistaceae bacterium]|jgi:bifunctional UDP-N-acetylglucosamine pyrophosphorylase/glucosamine-1-phosphate N-acetyltransferase|nr:bifunctional UDP-N-acetylglucosamine diphosphorylase/glucosamine-1-phosphate N-acetyltransferase GlmU [Synergistaceae bacterium]
MSIDSQSLGVLILAAGKGTRMHSEKPKVLQSLLEEPVVYYPLKAAHDAGLRNIAVLVGHMGEMVESYIREEWSGVEVIWQLEQLGTGHALMVARDWWSRFDDVMVLYGDVPLVRSETLSGLVERHFAEGPQCTFLSTVVDNPSGYGRVVRLADGGVRIVEDKDALEDELEINEINAGVYMFSCRALSVAISQVGRKNAVGEYYLPDAIHMIGETEGDVNVIICDDDRELIGVNTPLDLAETSRELNRRMIQRHMMNGLKCMDPGSTWIGPRVEFDEDVFLEPGVQIWGSSRLSNGSRVGAYSTLRDVKLGEHSVVIGPSVISDSDIGDRAVIGPFAVLRGGVVLKDDARVGRFVELKNSVVAERAKIPHLSYVGDAGIGADTNIGAGTVTCNYDGRRKYRTNIGTGCFVGSDTMLVAPVSMGDNSSTAAGSIITKDVPDGAMAISRSRQTNIDNWYERKNISRVSGEDGDKEG